ncbi:unnamed protein product, partial [Mesorhabditis spiculigera]
MDESIINIVGDRLIVMYTLILLPFVSLWILYYRLKSSTSSKLFSTQPGLMEVPNSNGTRKLRPYNLDLSRIGNRLQ